MTCNFQCELKDFRRQVLAKNFPNTIITDDITQVNPADIATSDLWFGGFPCQDLSLANQGKRKGLIGERSGLFFEFHRLLKHHKPKWIVLKNVPELLNSHNGKDFRVLLEALDELRYSMMWRTLDAKYFGTPQRRRRVFITGSFGRVLFEPEGGYFTPKLSMGKRPSYKSSTGESNDSPVTYTIQHAGINRKHTAGPQAKGYRSDCY
jgi:DNA (cytosine-5)-methyltransferase 1